MSFICAFSAHFNMHIGCIVWERQHVKNDENKGQILHFLPPVKITKGGQNARVSVSSSAEDSTSYYRAAWNADAV